MASRVEELKAYFHAFNGSENAWENRVKQGVEKLYHPELAVVTGEGEKSKAEMVNFVKNLRIKVARRRKT
jgi:plasmid replication initiation protein